MNFDFCIDGPPISSQARRQKVKKAWSEQVTKAAKSAWPKDAVQYDGFVKVTMTNYFRGASLDVDNIPKLVLDALKGITYADDRIVQELTVRTQNLEGALRIMNVTQALGGALAGGGEFLHVQISPASED